LVASLAGHSWQREAGGCRRKFWGRGWGGVEGSEEELGERGLAEGDVEELANRRGGSHGRRRGRSIASAYGVQEQRGGRLKETDGALGGGVGSGRRHPFDFGVRVYGVM
jgi:hypothetical protein